MQSSSFHRDPRTIVLINNNPERLIGVSRHRERGNYKESGIAGSIFDESDISLGGDRTWQQRSKQVICNPSNVDRGKVPVWWNPRNSDTVVILLNLNHVRVHATHQVLSSFATSSSLAEHNGAINYATL